MLVISVSTGTSPGNCPIFCFIVFTHIFFSFTNFSNLHAPTLVSGKLVEAGQKQEMMWYLPSVVNKFLPDLGSLTNMPSSSVWLLLLLLWGFYDRFSSCYWDGCYWILSAVCPQFCACFRALDSSDPWRSHTSMEMALFNVPFSLYPHYMCAQVFRDFK